MNQSLKFEKVHTIGVGVADRRGSQTWEDLITRFCARDIRFLYL